MGWSMTERPDPLAILRTRRYAVLLLVAAAVGAPVSAAAYGFLALVGQLQTWLFADLPRAIGLSGEPIWWPVPLLAIAGVLVGAAIRYLPGHGGHSPADGFHAGGVPTPPELPGILLAALATLGLGPVLGPEAPLIALGAGLAGLVPLLLRQGGDPRATAMVGAAGSFAAVSTLFGSPLAGAFLLMEASGVGGPMLGVVLVPGLLAAGVGSLVFLGLDAWTGLGTFSLAIPNLPPAGRLDVAEFGWALAIGLAAALAAAAIRWLALLLRPVVERRMLLLTPAAGVVVAGLAVAYAAATGKSSADVLFSGQSALAPLVAGAAGYSAGALVLLFVCKGLAYGVSLSAFRGGPVFPAIFLGAAGGIALSHLPGLPLVTAVGMGIGAMTASMLRLPLTAVLLTTLLLVADGIAVMPVVIVAVVVAYVVTARLTPAKVAARAAVPAPAAGPAA
jgi:H+/Cl- antiporter ClcA